MVMDCRSKKKYLVSFLPVPIANISGETVAIASCESKDWEGDIDRDRDRERDLDRDRERDLDRDRELACDQDQQTEGGVCDILEIHCLSNFSNKNFYLYFD